MELFPREDDAQHERNEVEETLRNPRKRRGGLRVKYTDAMRFILEESFQRDMFPSKKERLRLAEATGISNVNISVWFQNRRSGRNVAGVLAAYHSTGASKEENGLETFHPKIIDLGDDDLEQGKDAYPRQRSQTRRKNGSPNQAEKHARKGAAGLGQVLVGRSPQDEKAVASWRGWHQDAEDWTGQSPRSSSPDAKWRPSWHCVDPNAGDEEDGLPLQLGSGSSRGGRPRSSRHVAAELDEQQQHLSFGMPHHQREMPTSRSMITRQEGPTDVHYRGVAHRFLVENGPPKGHGHLQANFKAGENRVKAKLGGAQADTMRFFGAQSDKDWRSSHADMATDSELSPHARGSEEGGARPALEKPLRGGRVRSPPRGRETERPAVHANSESDEEATESDRSSEGTYDDDDKRVAPEGSGLALIVREKRKGAAIASFARNPSRAKVEQVVHPLDERAAGEGSGLALGLREKRPGAGTDPSARNPHAAVEEMLLSEVDWALEKRPGASRLDHPREPLTAVVGLVGRPESAADGAPRRQAGLTPVRGSEQSLPEAVGRGRAGWHEGLRLNAPNSGKRKQLVDDETSPRGDRWQEPSDDELQAMPLFPMTQGSAGSPAKRPRLPSPVPRDPLDIPLGASQSKRQGSNPPELDVDGGSLRRSAPQFRPLLPPVSLGLPLSNDGSSYVMQHPMNGMSGEHRRLHRSSRDSDVAEVVGGVSGSGGSSREDPLKEGRRLILMGSSLVEARRASVPSPSNHALPRRLDGGSVDSRGHPDPHDEASSHLEPSRWQQGSNPGPTRQMMGLKGGTWVVKEDGRLRPLERRVGYPERVGSPERAALASYPERLDLPEKRAALSQQAVRQLDHGAVSLEQQRELMLDDRTFPYTQKKNSRLRLTETQRGILVQAFSRVLLPSEGMRRRLAERTGLSANQVATWFQNRRRRIKEAMLARQAQQDLPRQMVLEQEEEEQAGGHYQEEEAMHRRGTSPSSRKQPWSQREGAVADRGCSASLDTGLLQLQGMKVVGPQRVTEAAQYSDEGMMHEEEPHSTSAPIGLRGHDQFEQVSYRAQDAPITRQRETGGAPSPSHKHALAMEEEDRLRCEDRERRGSGRWKLKSEEEDDIGDDVVEIPRWLARQSQEKRARAKALEEQAKAPVGMRGTPWQAPEEAREVREEALDQSRSLDCRRGSDGHQDCASPPLTTALTLGLRQEAHGEDKRGTGGEEKKGGEGGEEEEKEKCSLEKSSFLPHCSPSRESNRARTWLCDEEDRVLVRGEGKGGSRAENGRDGELRDKQWGSDLENLVGGPADDHVKVAEQFPRKGDLVAAGSSGFEKVGLGEELSRVQESAVEAAAGAAALPVNTAEQLEREGTLAASPAVHVNVKEQLEQLSRPGDSAVAPALHVNAREQESVEGDSAIGTAVHVSLREQEPVPPVLLGQDIDLRCRSGIASTSGLEKAQARGEALGAALAEELLRKQEGVDGGRMQPPYEQTTPLRPGLELNLEMTPGHPRPGSNIKEAEVAGGPSAEVASQGGPALAPGSLSEPEQTQVAPEAGPNLNPKLEQDHLLSPRGSQGHASAPVATAENVRSGEGGSNAVAHEASPNLATEQAGTEAQPMPANTNPAPKQQRVKLALGLPALWPIMLQPPTVEQVQSLVREVAEMQERQRSSPPPRSSPGLPSKLASVPRTYTFLPASTGGGTSHLQAQLQAQVHLEQQELQRMQRQALLRDYVSAPAVDPLISQPYQRKIPYAERLNQPHSLLLSMPAQQFTSPAQRLVSLPAHEQVQSSPATSAPMPRFVATSVSTRQQPLAYDQTHLNRPSVQFTSPGVASYNSQTAAEGLAIKYPLPTVTRSLYASSNPHQRASSGGGSVYRAPSFNQQPDATNLAAAFASNLPPPSLLQRHAALYPVTVAETAVQYGNSPHSTTHLERGGGEGSSPRRGYGGDGLSHRAGGGGGQVVVGGERRQYQLGSRGGAEARGGSQWGSSDNRFGKSQEVAPHSLVYDLDDQGLVSKQVASGLRLSAAMAGSLLDRFGRGGMEPQHPVLLQAIPSPTHSQERSFQRHGGEERRSSLGGGLRGPVAVRDGQELYNQEEILHRAREEVRVSHGTGAGMFSLHVPGTDGELGLASRVQIGNWPGPRSERMGVAGSTGRAAGSADMAMYRGADGQLALVSASRAMPSGAGGEGYVEDRHENGPFTDSWTLRL